MQTNHPSFAKRSATCTKQDQKGRIAFICLLRICSTFTRSALVSRRGHLVIIVFLREVWSESIWTMLLHGISCDLDKCYADAIKYTSWWMSILSFGKTAEMEPGHGFWPVTRPDPVVEHCETNPRQRLDSSISIRKHKSFSGLHANYNSRLRRLQNLSSVFRDMIMASIATEMYALRAM